MIPLAAVIGSPIAHSKSPKLHGYWLQKYGINGHYIPLHVEQKSLGNTLKLLPSLGFRGINVTIPHKETVLEFCDQISDSAKAIGAANTLIFQDDKIQADNTDAYGFIENIRQTKPNWNFTGNTALVLGAGGAARAVIWSLLDAGVDKIILANRTVQRAKELQSIFGPKILVLDWQDITDSLHNIDLLINTTSLGMSGQPDLDLDLKTINPSALVTDIVYSPLKTRLLKHAEQKGCLTVDGLGMLLHQAVPGFEAWFGKRPTVDDDLRDHMLS